MRFTNLLTLLAATTALALKFKRDNQLTNVNGINIPTSTSKECAEVSKAIVTCFGDGTNVGQTDEEACNRYNTKECQSVVDQDYSVCGAEIGALYDATIDLSNVVCATDENGKFCPHSLKIQKNPKASYTDSDIQEMCKSKLCYEKALYAFTRMKKTTASMDNVLDKSEIDDTIDELNGYIKALNEDKCKAAAGVVNVGGGTGANTNTGASGSSDTAGINTGTTGATDASSTNDNDNNDSSGATHIIVESALLASLALALYFF